MMQDRTAGAKVSLFHLFLIFVVWLAITEGTPLLNSFLHLRQRPWLTLLAALRMALLLGVTYGYVRLYEKQRFAAGFHFSFGAIGRSLLWAFVFFLVAGAALMPYQLFIVAPLTTHAVQPSTAPSAETLAAMPLADRLIEFAYVVYEGVVEVLIFIGFLLDRLARRWAWPSAIVVANLAFGLWHYSYWQKGVLEGSLMVLLTVVAGLVISLNYVKTKNTFSAAVCHTLVDFPNSIRELLGML